MLHYCIILYYIILYYIILHYFLLYYIIFYSIIFYYILLYSILLYYVMLYHVISCYIMLYYIISLSLSLSLSYHIISYIFYICVCLQRHLVSYTKRNSADQTNLTEILATSMSTCTPCKTSRGIDNSYNLASDLAGTFW